MGALSVGLDLFTKAATLKVKGVCNLDDAIATVVDNVCASSTVWRLASRIL